MTTQTAPRVAIYARQSVDQDQGIRQQIADCRAEAERRGWGVIAEYPDNDTSGSTQRGPKTQWSAMLRAFDAGEFDALVVVDVDRLTRTLSDVLEVRPPKRDIRVFTVRGGIDTADSFGDYMFKQLVLLAEREVGLKTERARRYSLDRRKAGHPTSGMPPHGYRWVPGIERDESGTRYAIVENEAQDVRRVFSEFLAGAPLGQIARDLNAAGRRTRAGSQWRSPTIRRLLMNPLYAALLPPSQPTGKFDPAAIVMEHCTAGAWEPIIDSDTLLASRNRLIGVKPNHSGTARRWLLSGLATCSVCGESVRSARGESHPTARRDSGEKAPSTRYHTYRCPAGHFMRNGDIIDEFIAEVCIARLSEPDAIDMLVRRSDPVDIAVLHSRRVELESRGATVASMIVSGKLTPKDAEAALDQLSLELNAVNGEIAEAVAREPFADLIGLVDVRSWWEEATLARRRGVVELLMQIEIKPVGKGRRVTTLEAAAESVTVTWRGSPR